MHFGFILSILHIPVNFVRFQRFYTVCAFSSMLTVI